MWNGIKSGFGLAVGCMLGLATISFVKEEIMKWGAKDKDYMEWAEKNNPKMYEKLKEYTELS